MLKRLFLPAILALLAATAAPAQTFVEGRDFDTLVPAQPTHVAPGKVEVVEVFSYACPFCAKFNPFMQELRASLKDKAQFVYVAASFNKSEDWPMFQRAACTAQALGIFDRTHDKIFDAVWETGELAIADPNTHRLKSTLPSIEDAARYYSRIGGVPADKFVERSRQFDVDSLVRKFDSLMVAYRIDSTPTLIVNGKYRVTGTTAGSLQRMADITKWLAEREAK